MLRRSTRILSLLLALPAALCMADARIARVRRAVDPADSRSLS
jgi:hypothetical protein